MTGVLIGRGNQDTEIPSDAESSVCALVLNCILETVFGVKKAESLYCFDRQGGYSRLVPLHTDCPNAGEFGKELYSNGSRARLLIRIRVCAGPPSFHLASGGLLMSFSRLSNCDHLWKDKCFVK